MLGKQKLRKSANWLGKAVNVVDRANNWLGKAISSVEKTYGKGKKFVIKQASKVGLEEPVKSAFLHAEASPIGAFIESGLKQAKAFNQDVRTMLNNPATKLARAGLDYAGNQAGGGPMTQNKAIQDNSKSFIQNTPGNMKLRQFQTS